MNSGDEWDMAHSSRDSLVGIAGMGVLRVTLLFSSAAVALALIVAPIAANFLGPRIDEIGEGIDYRSTGSIRQNGSYTIRKSVLQDMPGALCVIHDNGRQIGDC